MANKAGKTMRTSQTLSHFAAVRESGAASGARSRSSDSPAAADYLANRFPIGVGSEETRESPETIPKSPPDRTCRNGEVV